MEAAPRLRVIATATTGLNHIDLDEAIYLGEDNNLWTKPTWDTRIGILDNTRPICDSLLEDRHVDRHARHHRDRKSVV